MDNMLFIRAESLKEEINKRRELLEYVYNIIDDEPSLVHKLFYEKLAKQLKEEEKELIEEFNKL